MIYILLSFVLITLIDKCNQRYFFPKARWFALHAAINFINIIGTQPALMHALKDPIHLSTNINIFSHDLNSCYSIWPTTLTLMLHLYHILFFIARKEEIMHHILFVPFLTCNLSYEAKNLTIFFGSGLPGMISYLCLTAKKYNLISYKQEKWISFLQNLLLRVPGLLFSAFSVFYSYFYANHSSFYFVGFICFLASMNGLYYLQQITGSYYLKT